ncbi:flavodoxin family protein [Goodfellowiella coeruleoviolacea]|uniref:Multimeric flavodoxin WrbA n=1 Tax=Goodfellowiella coeruleoviolacea TaxID=334858 RepID=A0AAE3GAE1_9PSEU|nr:flavodoxin family protein [Goodfellowiella coeruleoviolacea]MCP2163662.1 Multimeric flavodoxin WrbA [Goodfellowiella coeruleoviolacea]
MNVSDAATNSVRIAIAHDPGGGHTARFAEAVHLGATNTAGTESVLVPVAELGSAEWALLDSADAIVFGSPTYMGSASASFHAFAQASASRWLRQRWRDKLAAGFTNSGSKAGDKSSTLGYFATLAAQHGMVWVNLGLLPGWNRSRGSENDLNRLGFHNGAAAQSDVDSSPDAVHPADLRTAEHLGRRVAEYAAVVAAGRAALASLVR